MAYGVGTPADDWNQDETNHPENKVLNSSLPNPLTNHEGTTRRFAEAASNNTRTVYSLIDPTMRGPGSKSVRGFFRIQDNKNAILSQDSIIKPYLGINSQTGHADGYIAFVSTGQTGTTSDVCVSLGVGVRGDIGLGTYRHIAYSASLGNTTEFNGLWMGLRVDTIKEDNDTHIKIYFVKGPANCSNLDAEGEPDWGSPVVDIVHQFGLTAPLVLTGTKVSDFASATPWQDGFAFFAFASGWGTGSAITQNVSYIDSVRIKKM